MSTISQPLGAQSIKFLFAELRRTLDQAKSSSVQANPQYLNTVIARTFDALDNAVTSLYNAKQVSQTSSSGGSLKYTTIYSTVAVSQEGNHLQLQDNVVPQYAFLNAVTPGTVGNTVIDVQYSNNDVTWTSVLTTPLILPLGALFIPLVTTFSKTSIPKGTWLRTISSATTDITAKLVTLQMGFSISG